MSLFDASESKNRQQAQPLAARMRPKTLDEFVGQRHFLGEGKLLRRLLAAELSAGRHVATWDGRDDDGNGVASGTYFARLTGAGEVSTRKMLLLK